MRAVAAPQPAHTDIGMAYDASKHFALKQLLYKGHGGGLAIVSHRSAGGAAHACMRAAPHRRPPRRRRAVRINNVLGPWLWVEACRRKW